MGSVSARHFYFLTSSWQKEKSLVVETKWLDNGMNQCLIFEKMLVLVFHLRKDDFIYGSKSAIGPPNMGSFDGE